MLRAFCEELGHEFEHLLDNTPKDEEVPPAIEDHDITLLLAVRKATNQGDTNPDEDGY